MEQTNCRVYMLVGNSLFGGVSMLAYAVHNPAGELVLQAPESCRYSRQVELELLAAGYTIRLHGRKITKKELTESVKNRR